ncbi:hypothetical protein DSO57_1028953 [Entomophthora muscae]|uniref:Uncharacterized protein n=1 Tax=Entomophthora muscae TaxID=34485 RepID=A0ACC2RFZ7_9FUNG|nr:hypothetical protein DSO57_1028953 [Entomophthora muscae]
MAAGTKAVIQIKKIKVKPRKIPQPNPCLGEMAAVLNCWASLGMINARCSSAKAFATCMIEPPKFVKQKNDTNYHLARLSKYVL